MIDDDTLARALRTVEVGRYAPVEQLEARAHQIRNRRRVAAAGATAAVLALAVAAVALPNSLRDGAEPAPAGRPAFQEPDVVLDLDTLARGPEPLVPWYEPAGTLHFGSERTSHVIEFPDPVLRRVDGGFLVWESNDRWPEQTLVFVPDDGGDTVQLADGPISTPEVSPDGTRVAWAVGDEEWPDNAGDRPETDFTSTLVLADATTGEVLAELPGVPGPTTGPAGFLDDGTILVATGAGAVWGLSSWEPGEGLTPYRDGTAVEAMSPAGGLLALMGPTSVTEVVDVASDSTLWTLRDSSPLAFSPDGRYLAVQTEPAEDWVTPEDLATASPGDVIAREGHEVTVTQKLLDIAARHPDGWKGIEHVVVHDARTGEEVLRIEGELPEPQAVWESGDSLVVEAFQNRTRAALVRCTVGAGCELATDPTSLDSDPDTNDNPYDLGF